MRKSVILHIGLPKTGTSAIQAFLASNVDKLKRDGVLYPSHSSFDKAQRGGITSGNCSNKAEETFKQIFEDARRCPDGNRLLFSNELMFLQREYICNKISGMKSNFDFEVIFFVRNPMETAYSTYQQSVKRGGEYREFEEYAVNHRFLLEAQVWHQELSDLGVRTSVLNYSKTKKATIRRFLEVLNCTEMLREQSYVTAEKRIVNRSLSPMELKIVRSANQKFGKKVGRALSDRLVEISPDVRPQEVLPSESLEKIFQERFEPSVSYFNKVLPEGDELEISHVKNFKSESVEVKFQDEEFLSIAAAFNAVLTDRGPELERLQLERDALLKDRKARKSKLAEKIDYWDYKIHAILGGGSIFGKDFAARFKIAAERRHRSCYDK